ncbi:hypothetical protein GCM10023340_26070 [Nocardioides marinquilinus]|uniref:HTH luxR-type domain-containing protein n=1 Tax=Nocardioides marinquilinus TaxID=1210400 RepID=A0ABP9PVY7_9ACTN
MTLSSGPTPDAGSLTAREKEVLDLVARGLSNAEIVQETGLSINSVKSFIRGAYRKIGAENRGDATMWARAHGFGDDEAAS